MLVREVFAVRDTDGEFLPNLSPKFVLWQRIDNRANMTPPAVLNYGSGFYSWAWDAKYGECFGLIDMGSTVASSHVRYLEVYATREPGAILSLPQASLIQPTRRGLIAWVAARLTGLGA